MSDVKKPAKPVSTKRIIDVQHPGKSAPSPTSKPVIVTNRPVLQDPMVVGSTEGAQGNDTKILSSPAKIKIQPLTAPVVKSQVDKSEAENKDDKTSAKTPMEAPAEAAAAPEAPLPADESVKNLPELPAEESMPAATKSAQLSSETTEPEAKEEPEQAAKPDNNSSADEPADESSGNEAADQTESGAKADTGKPEGDKATEDADVKEAKAAEEAAKHDAAIQALADSKKYYLPVNSVEKRRTKRVVVLGVVLSVLLALAWADIALDAGLVHVNGVKPVTHFFSN